MNNYEFYPLPNFDWAHILSFVGFSLAQTFTNLSVRTSAFEMPGDEGGFLNISCWKVQFLTFTFVLTKREGKNWKKKTSESELLTQNNESSYPISSKVKMLMGLCPTNSGKLGHTGKPVLRARNMGFCRSFSRNLFFISPLHHLNLRKSGGEESCWWLKNYIGQVI